MEFGDAKISDKISFLADRVSQHESWVADEVRTYLRHNEWVVAFDLLCSKIDEVEMPLSAEEYSSISDIANYFRRNGANESETKFEYLKYLVE